MKKILFIFLLISNISISQTPTTIKQLFQEAVKFEDKGDFENAIKTQMKIFKLDSNNYVSANIIAGLYGKLENFSEEILWAKKSSQINPKYADAYINLGNAFFGLGNINSAEKSFSCAVKIDSLNHFGYYSLGLIEESRKNLTAAISFYQKSVKVNPKFEEGYFNLAAAYANLKQFEKANFNISKVLELNPNEMEAKEMQKQILQEMKK